MIGKISKNKNVEVFDKVTKTRQPLSYGNFIKFTNFLFLYIYYGEVILR